MYSILLVHSGPDDSTKGGTFLPVVLLIHPDCFGVRCTVLEMSAVEMNYMVLKATKNIFEKLNRNGSL